MRAQTPPCAPFVLAALLCMLCAPARGDSLPPLDPKQREYFGELYNPTRHAQCVKQVRPGDRTCELYGLRRQEQPEYWPAGSRAAAVKWPEPARRAIYGRTMTAREYFLALCEAEAGETIAQTADAVESIYQIRPRRYEDDIALTDRFVIEDPYGYVTAPPQFRALYYVQPPEGQYEFLEIPGRKTDGSIAVYFRDLNSNPGKKHYAGMPSAAWPYVVAERTATEVRSKYGFTWRGIKRERDRELGIAGGETIVVELATGRVLGVRRGFLYSNPIRGPHRIHWMSAERCPDPLLRQAEHVFIERVLKPQARTIVEIPAAK